MYLLYASRHFEEALEWAKTSAKNNNPRGQYLLAQYCRHGTPPDFETAHLLYRKAAAQGLPEAHWQLGLQYRFGQGTKTDTAQAVNHLRAAAQQGYIPAYTPLAELILPTAPDEAVYRFQQAAQENDPDAHAALADIYLQGKYLERNHKLALHHAEAAAAERHPEGLRIPGDICRYGLGIALDTEKARHYYRQAAEAGSLTAYQKLISDSALNHPEQYDGIKDSAIRRQRAEQLYQKPKPCITDYNAHPNTQPRSNCTQKPQNSDTAKPKPIWAVCITSDRAQPPTTTKPANGLNKPPRKKTVWRSTTSPASITADTVPGGQRKSLPLPARSHKQRIRAKKRPARTAATVAKCRLNTVTPTPQKRNRYNRPFPFPPSEQAFHIQTAS